jgi:hypothetical protein
MRDGERAATQKVELQTNLKTTMSYINEFEVELEKKLNGSEDTATIIGWVAEKILESYRNGIKAGKNGEQVHRNGTSRRKGTFHTPSPARRNLSARSQFHPKLTA